MIILNTACILISIANCILIFNAGCILIFNADCIYCFFNAVTQRHRGL